jgi:hypothetical protein
VSTSRVIVAGSRGFNDYSLLRSKLDAILSQLEGEVVIVSGGAEGADKLGERYARERNCFVMQMPVSTSLWDGRGRGAGYTRNALMAEIATHCIVFWDGESRGSKHMIGIATKLGLPLRVIRYKEGQGD